MVSLSNAYSIRSLALSAPGGGTAVAQAATTPKAASSPFTVAVNQVLTKPATQYQPRPTVTPVSSPPPASPLHAGPESKCGTRGQCGNTCCDSPPSPSTPATVGGPGAPGTALPAPSLSLATVGSGSSLPPPAGSKPPAPGKDSADPKAVGAWLQQNGGLMLWVIVALVLIAVLAPGARSRW